MSWFNRKKKQFLNKLMVMLGYGGMVAYCMGGCDSKQAQNTTQTSPVESQIPEADESGKIAEEAAVDKPQQMPETEAVEQNRESADDDDGDVLEINGTQSEDVNNTAAESDSAATEPEELAFEINYTPKNAGVYKVENGKKTVICRLSPCKYLFDTSRNSEKLTIESAGYKTQKIVLSKDKHTKSQGMIKVALHRMRYPKNIVTKYGVEPPPDRDPPIKSDRHKFRLAGD